MSFTWKDGAFLLAAAFVGHYVDSFLKPFDAYLLGNIHLNSIDIIFTSLGVIGTTIIIYDKFFRPRKEARTNNHLDQNQSASQITLEPSFYAEIVDKKQVYVRGIDSIHFRSRFRGTLTNGFFANRINTPETIDGTTLHINYFHSSIPDISEDKRAVISRCQETLEVWTDRGKLDGNINTDWMCWEWSIPEYAPLGLFKVQMMVWNTFRDQKKEPYRIVEDSVSIIDPDDSHY
jgi:hypothetical protein